MSSLSSMTGCTMAWEGKGKRGCFIGPYSRVGGWCDDARRGIGGWCETCAVVEELLNSWGGFCKYGRSPGFLDNGKIVCALDACDICLGKFLESGHRLPIQVTRSSWLFVWSSCSIYPRAREQVAILYAMNVTASRSRWPRKRQLRLLSVCPVTPR